MLAISRRTWSFVFLFLMIILSSQQTIGAAATTVPDNQLATVDTFSLNAAMAASLTSAALSEARHILRSTYERELTQANVSRHLEAMMRSEGADGALAFPTLVMSGPELALPHGDHLDDETHIINPATEPVVMIDIGCKYRGHSSDVTRTFFFETATQEMLDAYSAVLAAEVAIIDAIGPGVEISDLDAIMRTHLSDYYNLEGVTVLTYWGHGVGRYVHEQPILANVAGELAIDDVLAIEPGIYFDAGWAVRVEDTVLVTETGFEVLSNVPKTIDEIWVNQTQPFVSGDLSFTNYDYGHTTTAVLSINDSAGRDVCSVELFNGYSWVPMSQQPDTQYSISYELNYTYSSFITCMSRIQFTNDTYYFTKTASTKAEATRSEVLDPTISVNADSLLPDHPLIWTLTDAGAMMIRVRFVVIDGGWDQILVKDAVSRTVIDYRLTHDKFLWTPWVAGDTLSIHVVATEPAFLGGVESFRFTIDILEIIDEDLVLTTSTITTTDSVTPTTTSDTEPTTPSTPESTTTVPDLPLGLILTTVSGLAVVTVVLVIIRFKVKNP